MSEGYRGNRNAKKYEGGAVRKNVTLDPEVVEAVKRKGEKLSPLINRLLREWLKKK